MDCSRGPRGTRSPGQDSPAPAPPLNPSVAQPQEAPSRSQLASSRDLKPGQHLRPAEACLSPALFGRHLTHIHSPPPLNVSLFPWRPFKMHASASKTRSGGKRGWREGQGQRKTRLYLAGKTQAGFQHTGGRVHIRWRLRGPRDTAQSSDAPRHTQRTHTPQDHCQAQMQSQSLVPPPRPTLSRASQTGAHPLAGAVCTALSSADFRKPEGEITHVGRQWGGRREVPTGACPPP